MGTIALLNTACSQGMRSSRLSLVSLLVLLSCLVVCGEEGSCSKDSSDCEEEEKSLMLETNIGENNHEVEDDNGVVKGENTNVNSETSIDDDDDEIQEVDGAFEPCNKTEKGGQLYRMMIESAGYQLSASSKMTRVHCQPEIDSFLSNGYYETRGYLEGEEVLIVAMMPSQGLQPHAHDITEDITVSFGEMAYFTWLEGPGVPSNRTVSAGTPVGVVGGVTHAVFAGPEGVVYHEPAGKDTAVGKTWFAPS